MQISSQDQLHPRRTRRSSQISPAGGQRRRRARGSSVVEVSLMAPWIFFLFIGIFDLGFYMYAGIATENAARVAAARTAADPYSQTQAIACAAATSEMKPLPNGGSIPASCNAAPLIVTQSTLCADQTKVVPASIACTTTGAGPPNGCADCGADDTAASSKVSVTYQTIPLVPIPGLLTGRLNLTRIVETRIIAQ